MRHGEEKTVAGILSYWAEQGRAGRRHSVLVFSLLTGRMILALRKIARFLSRQEHALQRDCSRDGWGPGPGLKQLIPLWSGEEGAVGL